MTTTAEFPGVWIEACFLGVTRRARVDSFRERQFARWNGGADIGLIEFSDLWRQVPREKSVTGPARRWCQTRILMIQSRRLQDLLVDRSNAAPGLFKTSRHSNARE